MLVPEKAEFEQKQPFEKGRCIDFSLRSILEISEHFVFIPMMAQARDFEERFLGVEVNRDKESILKDFRIPAVGIRMQERISQLVRQNSVAVFTDKELIELIKQVYREERQVGVEIRNRAQELGLVNTQSSKEIAQGLGNAGRCEYLEREVQILRDHGDWQIYQGKEEKFLLVASQTERIGDQLNTVDLDDLFVKDPEFLKDKIRKYYELQGVSHAVEWTLACLGDHKVFEKSMVYKLFGQMSGDLKEVRELATFLTWFGRLDREYTSLVANFITGFKTISGVRVDSSLAHMKVCPGESESTHQRITALQEAYTQFASINFNTHRPPEAIGLSADTQTLSLVRDPLRFIEAQFNKKEEEVRADQARYIQFAQFIEDTRDIKNPEQLLQDMQQQLPDTFALLEQSREWLGEDYSGQNKLGEIIKRASLYIRDVSLRDIIHENVRQMIENSFRLASKDSPAKILLSWLRTGIHNVELIEVIALCAAKLAQSRNELTLGIASVQDSLEGEEQQYLKELYRQRAEKLEQYVDAIAKEHRKKAEDLAKDRSAIGNFLARTGISEKAVNDLVLLAIKPEDGKTKSTYNARISFAIAFNALFLYSQGQLDVKSPAFRSLVREVFPYVEDEILDILQNAA